MASRTRFPKERRISWKIRSGDERIQFHPFTILFHLLLNKECFDIGFGKMRMLMHPRKRAPKIKKSGRINSCFFISVQKRRESAVREETRKTIR